MVCAKQVTGWPVVDSEGTELGRVERLVISDTMALVGVIVRKGSELAIVSPDEVVFGDHLLWVASSSCFKSLSTGEESAYSHLLGREVLDINGQVSGIAHDFVLDPVRKSVTGLELSDGLIADWLRGRQVASAYSLQWDGQRWICVDLSKEGAGSIT